MESEVNQSVLLEIGQVGERLPFTVNAKHAVISARKRSAGAQESHATALLVFICPASLDLVVWKQKATTDAPDTK